LLQRWLFYLSLAFKDLYRLRSATLIQAMVVAGICLPVLVLVMLKRGLVADLRNDLVTSPTGRQVKLYCSGHGRFFARNEIPDLLRKLGRVELAIPEVTIRGCTLTSRGQNTPRSVGGVDLISSAAGDPILRAHNADVLTPDARSLILNRHLAEELGVAVNEIVTLSVRRSAGSEMADVTLEVNAIIPGDSSSRVGFVDCRTLDRVVTWQRGGGVSEWNWSPLLRTPPPRYPTFLVVTEIIDPLTEADIRLLTRRGFLVEPVDLAQLQTLSDLLKPGAGDQLSIHRIWKPGPRDEGVIPVAETPESIARKTPAGDIVLPWCEPVEAKLNGETMLLTGLSLPLYSEWFRDMLCREVFETGSDPLQVVMSPDADGLPTDARLELGDGSIISLAVSVANGDENVDLQRASASRDVDRRVSLPVRVVPASLLAQIEAAKRGEVCFDRGIHAFVPVPPAPSYEEMRLYGLTIDDVPGIVRRASELGYGFQSQNTRIEEIQSQDAALRLLVLIVGASVFSFGVFTVVSVLVESTDRKRNMIGILRIIGASRFGLFSFVCLRAALIGLMGGGVSVAMAFAIARLLGIPQEAITVVPESLRFIKPTASAVMHMNDCLAVVGASVVCCSTGAVLPAWRAIRQDPVDSVIEGRFQ